ncbi:hypothetical protein NC652_024490 [Populus alba x Populus x berolinensis]|nr:hypothetical protein NC652_024490 [Populus alba x Populus x berolinensis]
MTKDILNLGTSSNAPQASPLQYM